MNVAQHRAFGLLKRTLVRNLFVGEGAMKHAPQETGRHVVATMA
jgi:hypothetical protein